MKRRESVLSDRLSDRGREHVRERERGGEEGLEGEDSKRERGRQRKG